MDRRFVLLGATNLPPTPDGITQEPAFIVQVDPQTGTVLRTIESNRIVTGVTWVEGEM